MEDILQQDCDFLFDLQDDYSRSSLGGSSKHWLAFTLYQQRKYIEAEELYQQ
jgi:TolA-binding protein